MILITNKRKRKGKRRAEGMARKRKRHILRLARISK